MSVFTLEDLADIAQDVIGGRKKRLLFRDMSAEDVPGWDSLNHTLIVIEIGERVGKEFSSRVFASLSNFGEMIDFVNREATGPNV